MAVPSWSKDRIAAHLNRSGLDWNSYKGQAVEVSYSFLTVNPGYGSERYGFSAFSEEQIAAAQTALGRWAEVSGLTFTQNQDNGGKNATVRLANTTTGPQVAWAYLPSSYYSSGGDVWINPNYGYNKGTKLQDGEYGMLTMVHELGHALGLSHPGNYNGTASLSQRDYAQDTMKYTVMSYFNHNYDAYAYADGPLLHDIYAIQKMYGVNWDTRNTDTTYSWDDSSYFVKSIWDGGGSDIIDASNQTRRVIIKLGQGTFSSIGTKHYSTSLARDNLSIAYGAVIENATGGSGHDFLYGNGFNNVLTGNNGDDTLDGKGGNDLLKGGAGNDTYIFAPDWGVDVIDDSEGVNTLKFSFNKINTERSGNDLLIRQTGRSNLLTVRNYYLDPSKFRILRKGVLFTPGTGEMRDDGGNVLGEAAEYTVGSDVTGRIDYNNDRDTYKVQLTAGENYIFDLKGKSSADGTMSNPYLYLYDQDGKLIARNDNGGAGYNARIKARVYETGTYYLLAKHRSSTGKGTYTLSSQQGAEDAQLTVGVDANGTISTTNEKDWYQVTLTKGQVYRFDLKGKSSGSGTLSNPYLQLYDADGNRLIQNDNGGAGYDAKLYYLAEETGTYYVKAFHKSTGRGTYVLSAQNVGGTASIEAGQTLTGTISDSLERDYYAITLDEGDWLGIDLKGRSSGNGTLYNPYLRVLDANGNVVGSNNNSGAGYDARLNLFAFTSGTYYIEARHSSGGKGSYSLSVKEHSTASVASVGVSVQETISASREVDWYKVDLAMGAQYRIDMRGRSSGYGTLYNPYLRIYDAHGNLLKSNNNSGKGYDARLSFVAKESGTYYIKAFNSGTHRGTYNLKVTQVGASSVVADADDDTAAKATALAVGGLAQGNIDEVGDRDFYKVSLTNGVQYRFDAQSNTTVVGEYKALNDPFLTLYDTNGTTVLQTDNNSGGGKDALMTFTAAETGDYYLKVTSNIANYGSYRLLAAQIG